MNSIMVPYEYGIEARWEARQEPVRDSAVRVLRMLRTLGHCRPGFDRWTQGAWTRREANVPFSTLPLQVGPMMNRLEAERVGVRKGRPFLSSNHSFSASNMAFGRPVHLSGSIDWSETISEMPNHVALALRYETEVERQKFSVDLIKAVLLALVDAWEPAIGRIDPPGLWTPRRDGAGRPVLARFRAGWMTYLAPPFARQIQPPSGAVIESLLDGGMLILATGERFEIENAGHRAIYDAIQAAMTPLNDMAWPPANYLRVRPSLPDVGSSS